MSAKFIGVGVGPGDPELITLKAARYIQQADVISYIANEQGSSQAKTIARMVLGDVKKSQDEIPLIMPMSEDRTQANSVYDQAADAIKRVISQGKTVVFLCEGDPLFFGSFTYLLERIQNNVSAVAKEEEKEKTPSLAVLDDQSFDEQPITCEIVPGISSVHAASSALQIPLTVLTESFTVMSGRHSDEQLLQALRTHDSVVIMKAGRSRQKIIQALHASQRIHEAQYLEYIGRDEQRIEHNVESLRGEAGPYFSLFVITPSDRKTR